MGRTYRYYIALERVLANMESSKTGNPLQYWGKDVVKRLAKMIAEGEIPLEIVETGGQYYLEVEVPIDELLEGEDK